MRKMILLFFMLGIITDVAAQNVGIGTTEPLNKLHIVGNLLVNTPTVTTATAPTAGQTKTMVNASTITFTGTDSTGRIYDPGGPAGNYNANLFAQVDINVSTNIGIEVTVESMQLGTGDSLLISESLSYPNLLAVGNGYSTTGKWIFNSGIGQLHIIFKSNADASVGSGFSLLFRRLYNNSQSLPDISGYAGNTLFFDTKSGAFRAGTISTNEIGPYSNALGYNTTASGDYSTAMGAVTIASGNFSTAMGSTTKALGNGSIAMGGFSNAYGDYSIAMGSSAGASGNSAVSLGYLTSAIGNSATAIGTSTFASGLASTAMGNSTTASASYSTAMGTGTEATGYASTAIGRLTNATGDYSTAMGNGTTAGGDNSTAMGSSTTASGISSTALGGFTTASGNFSTATGFSTTASGVVSTAMGYNASTNGQANSFAIGGTGAATICSSPNQFMTRFDNYTFWISASNYAYLLPSSNGWAYTSDKNKKERFEELDGESVLKKISGIPFSSWNFKASDTRQYRHYGITAQDFYNAFGKDSYGNIGNDTTVSPLDLLGVAYSAIKALEKRSTGLLQDNKQLKEENALLQKNIDEIKAGFALTNSELNKKLALLEVMLNELAALKEKKVVVPNTVAIRNP